jgi:hypothetical protein
MSRILTTVSPLYSCTSFLKTIANNRFGFLSVNGDVSYGGIPAREMGKRYRGEVVYNQEDDVHAATLTVAQTLLFALKVKTPGKLLPGKSRKEFNNEVMELLLRMLGISHTKNTKVGSAVVRGVSGGERKRVSIAEMVSLLDTFSQRSSLIRHVLLCRWRLVRLSLPGTTRLVAWTPRPLSTTPRLCAF